jgi:tetraacyldisaccharide 4'-kinase
VLVDSAICLKIISGERRDLLAALTRGALVLASAFYLSAVYFRNKLYDWGWLARYQVSVPVVVIGNLTVGGTGKTPTVEAIANFYLQQKRHVTILSRGYGSKDKSNDEALVLEANLPDIPHVLCADRVRAAEQAIEKSTCDLLLLDDGFQHRRLQRNLDIVLVDATNPWGYGRCLPRGLLREPRSALRRAAAVIITRADQVSPEKIRLLRDEITRYMPNRLIAETRHKPHYLENSVRKMTVGKLRSQPVAAFCGVGNPGAFLTTLTDLGADIVAEKTFRDHFAYQHHEIRELERWAQTLPADTWLVTTQKDWVKLQLDTLGERPLWFLRIALEFTQGEEALHALLLRVIQRDDRVGQAPACQSTGKEKKAGGSLPYDAADAA